MVVVDENGLGYESASVVIDVGEEVTLKNLAKEPKAPYAEEHFLVLET